MPPSQHVFPPAHLSQSPEMSHQPLTPPCDSPSTTQRMRSPPASPTSHTRHTSHVSRYSVDDNTAAGMALSQEDSMYLTPAASPTAIDLDERNAQGNMQSEDKVEEDGIKHPYQTRDAENRVSSRLRQARSRKLAPASSHKSGSLAQALGSQQGDNMDIDQTAARADRLASPRASPDRSSLLREEILPKGLSKVDVSLNRTSDIPPWDFTDKKPIMKSPSSLFQPCAKYVGTQQSDRQTYNVEVTVLNVDMDQCSMAGYLLIRGLTPEHPMLQTFFTGQIVGGPNQRYSFRTKDPSWGANDKVIDLQHWLRFPAWRHLTAHAKRDMNFEFPLNHEPWYTQEHIFMRWKEHFLVPDHKQSNIQGASFEGFYYICLNQLEGKISGVYFHSKSERYQQLELTHVTKRGLGVFGVSPLVELR